MNNKYKFLGFFVVFLALTLIPTGCNKDFDEFNQNPTALTNADLERDYRIFEPFKTLIRGIYMHTPPWQTQLQQNLIGDVYSGYMMPPTPFAGNSNNMTYNLVDGWNTWAFNISYVNVMSSASFIEKNGQDFPEFLAWLKIVKVEGMHRLADMFGPIMYSQYGKLADDGTIAYDCLPDLYETFFRELDEGIAGLEAFQATGKPSPFGRFDEVYAGDIDKWIKFANTLRLRLAIRVSKVDPALAQTQGEKSLTHPLGLITVNDENFTVKNAISHPVNTINTAWNDVRMGAPMESILVGYEDPRLPKFFEPAEQANVAGEFKGIRQGIDISSKDTYIGFSKIAPLGDVQLMVAAEAQFLVAEAALRQWNTGGVTAKDAYENAIQISFDQYGLGDATDYFNDDAKTPNPYVDPNNAANNLDAGNASLSTMTIKWDASDDFETNLERIITQKWIAMFPDGQEAWSEYRRTGYPKLFPVMVNNSGGEIDTDAGIKRIKYISGEYSLNPKGVKSGVDCLGGPDTGGTPLWWDVD